MQAISKIDPQQHKEYLNMKKELKKIFELADED